MMPSLLVSIDVTRERVGQVSRRDREPGHTVGHEYHSGPAVAVVVVRRWFGALVGTVAWRAAPMSIELCQSSTSLSLMWANTPRLDAHGERPEPAASHGLHIARERD